MGQAIRPSAAVLSCTTIERMVTCHVSRGTVTRERGAHRNETMLMSVLVGRMSCIQFVFAFYSSRCAEHELVEVTFTREG